MPPRLLDAVASDFMAMTALELAASIRAAEGRTVAAEVICTADSPVEGVSSGELAAAFGADIIVFDQYDCDRPIIKGAPASVMSDSAPLRAYKRLIGRPVGINLVVGDPSAGRALGGRLATRQSVSIAVTQGVDVIFLYARPGIGGTLELQVRTASEIREQHNNTILLLGVPTFSQPAPRSADDVQRYAEQCEALLTAGCDGIGLPLPGSKQGWQPEPCAALVDVIHQHDALAWLFLTGSVEGAPEATMSSLALTTKQIGADAVRLDDAGLSGMAVPENILSFSLALRGKRHTYRRIAASVHR